MKKKLKHLFLEAVALGEIGMKTEKGLIVTTSEFVMYFENNGESKRNYLRSYLPSVAIEAGRRDMKHNKFLFKVGRGTFKIHEDAVDKYCF